MTTRKTVGWLVFAALAVIFVLQVPRIAARGYIHLGSSYFALKRYGQAEKAYLHAKALADDSCAACGLGMTYSALGRHDDAEKEFQRSMRLNPNDVCPYAQLGTMYYDIGKYPEAIATFKRAIALSPSYGSYMLLGNSYVYTRDYEPSIEAYKKAIQIDPKNVRAYYQLGISYDYQRRYEESIKVYNDVLKIDPDHQGARYYLAVAYAAQHNKRAAIEQYEILRKKNAESAADLLEAINLSEKRQIGKEKLYFVPLGDFSTASLTKFASSSKQKTGIEVIVTQPVPFALTTVDKRRQQVIAEEAINLMRAHYPELASDPNAIVIGLTNEDLFIRGNDDQYAFCYRMLHRFAVVSSARMDPTNLGGAANDLVTETRMRKMLLKNIGILYYHMPVNHDPKSLLFEDVEEVKDIDKMGEDF